MTNDSDLQFQEIVEAHLENERIKENMTKHINIERRLRLEIWGLRVCLLVVIAMSTGGWIRLNQWRNKAIAAEDTKMQLLTHPNENRTGSLTMLHNR